MHVGHLADRSITTSREDPLTVIRNKDAAGHLKNAIVLDLSDLGRQASVLKQRAQADAEHIVAHAHARATKLVDEASVAGHEEGHRKGYTEGCQKGREQGRVEAIEESRSDIEHLIESWSRALDDFEQIRQTLQVQARQDVLQLALNIAQRIVYRIVEYDPSVIADQLAEAIKLTASKTAIIVTVHPADLERSREILPEIANRLADGADITVLTDAQLSPGGCIIRAGQGEVDATIETQITRITEALLPAAPMPAETETAIDTAGATPVDAEQTTPDEHSPSPMDPEAIKPNAEDDDDEAEGTDDSLESTG